MKQALIDILKEMRTTLARLRLGPVGTVVPHIRIETSTPGTDFNIYLN